MKIKELIKELQKTINLGNYNAEVRIDFNKEGYHKKFGISFDDIGDVLIYEVEQ